MYRILAQDFIILGVKSAALRFYSTPRTVATSKPTSTGAINNVEMMEYERFGP